jgi:hypothetical protein
MTERPTKTGQRTKRLILAAAMIIIAIWIGLMVYTLGGRVSG